MISYNQFLIEGRPEWKAQPDESEIVHHVTNHNFEQFRPFSHFGSQHVARDRAADSSISASGKVTHITARLKLGNVVHVPDIENHYPTSIAKCLAEKGHITAADVKKIDYTPGGEGRRYLALSKLVRSKGIHTIAYKNEFEGPGDTSYMITHPNQVRILSKTHNTRINKKRATKYK